MRLHHSILAAGIVLLSFRAVAAEAKLTLVRDGQPAAVIVVADNATFTAREAAKELQSWVRKASGAVLPIKAEGRLARDSRETPILVGDTSRTAALGLRSATFELEEIRIRTFPGALVILGDDARPDGVRLSGTLWAVEAFAEQCLGVRVLWPGELGEVVPKQASIEIGDINLRQVPAIRKRAIRHTDNRERIQKGLDELGWSADDFNRHAAQAEPWFRFQRLGGSFLGNYGHAFGDYWERFHIRHPEWFALQPNGTRDNSKAEGGRRAQLCVSNRALIEQVARDCVDKLRKQPLADCVSISPNDGSAVTFCLCDSCNAWDAPEGEIVDLWGPNGVPTKHVSLSDRYVKFYSSVAELVAGEIPDRKLGAYAYTAYKLPPLHAKLHPNVVLGFVGFDYLDEDYRRKSRDSWLKWSEMAGQIFLRPNALMAGMGHPEVYVHRLADDLRFCAEHKMMAADFDCCFNHWAGDGLNYYVLAKLLWNPATDVDAVVADYCRAGFGPAADAVREYFRYLEEKTSEFARANASQERGKKKPELLAAWCTDDYYSRCRALLDAADRTAGDNELVRKRIAFLRTAVEAGQLRHQWAAAKAAAKSGDRDAAKRVRTLEQERDAWYRQLGITWAVNAPSLKFYGF